jgi:hypothetical protein
LTKHQINQMPLRLRPAAPGSPHDPGKVKIGDGIGSPVCRPDIRPAAEVACLAERLKLGSGQSLYSARW